LLPTAVKIFNPTIPSNFVDTGHQRHPHMECDQPTLPIRVVDSPISHEILDFEFPSKEDILDITTSIEDPKDEVMHQSFFPHLEYMRFSMMSLDLRLGEFVGKPSDTHSLDPFQPRLSFS
jgi:hypothetical protein